MCHLRAIADGSAPGDDGSTPGDDGSKRALLECLLVVGLSCSSPRVLDWHPGAYLDADDAADRVSTLYLGEHMFCGGTRERFVTAAAS